MVRDTEVSKLQKMRRDLQKLVNEGKITQSEALHWLHKCVDGSRRGKKVGGRQRGH